MAHATDEINTPMLAIVGVAGAVLVFVIIVALMVWFYNLQEVETYKKDLSQSPEEITNLLSQQQGQLYGYRVDQASGVAQLDIEHAMELVVRDAKEDPTLRQPVPPRPATQPSTRPATTTKGASGHDGQ